MSKQTLIDMTQDILAAMGSDQVNAITDTSEANMVVRIIKRVYFDIISTRYWPHLQKMVKLIGLASTSTPSHFKMPDNLQKLEILWYDIQKQGDTRKKYAELQYMNPYDFMIMLNSRKSDETTVDTITDIDGRELLILNNVAPSYWTSFDDEYIVLDSYDNLVESAVQEHKTQILVYEEPTWTESNTYIPDLPSKAFEYLKAEAMSTAFNEIRQAANPKAEQKARRLRTWLSQEKFRQNGELEYPNYGR